MSERAPLPGPLPRSDDDASPLPGDLVFSDVARLIAVDLRTRDIAASIERHDDKLDGHVRLAATRHAEIKAELDSVRADVLRAVGELASKLDGKNDAVAQAGVAAIEAAVAVEAAREEMRSHSNEHDAEITGVHKAIERHDAADVRLEAALAAEREARAAEVAALKKADKVLASRVRWRIGAAISGAVALAGALWKIFELTHPGTAPLPFIH